MGILSRLFSKKEPMTARKFYELNIDQSDNKAYLTGAKIIMEASCRKVDQIFDFIDPGQFIDGGYYMAEQFTLIYDRVEAIIYVVPLIFGEIQIKTDELDVMIPTSELKSKNGRRLGRVELMLCKNIK